MYDEFQAANTEIYGASFDTVEENHEFAQNNDFPYPLLCDPGRQMGPSYGAGDGGYASRIGVILDEHGTVLWAGPASAQEFPSAALEIVQG